MAKINNQAVVQKLIDELKLYPGADQIPTEIADKILAVYQINSEELTVSGAKATIVRDAVNIAQVLGNNDTTIYTTPATGDFYLVNASVSLGGSAGAGGGALWNHAYIIITIDGTERAVVCASNGTTSNRGTSNAVNLQNPIKVDPSTAIKLRINCGYDDQNASGTGSIVGYLIQ